MIPKILRFLLCFVPFITGTPKSISFRRERTHIQHTDHRLNPLNPKLTVCFNKSSTPIMRSLQSFIHSKTLSIIFRSFDHHPSTPNIRTVCPNSKIKFSFYMPRSFLLIRSLVYIQSFVFPQTKPKNKRTVTLRSWLLDNKSQNHQFKLHSHTKLKINPSSTLALCLINNQQKSSIMIPEISIDIQNVIKNFDTKDYPSKLIIDY